MEMALKDRIQEILEAGYRKGQLAKLAGVTPSAVTHWLSGGSQEIKGEPAAKLESATGFSAAWIATGKGQKRLSVENSGVQSANVSAAPSMKMVPVLNTVNAGMFEEIIDAHPEDIEYTPVDIAIGKYAFALRVEGDSMEPGFPDGCIVIIDPNASPKPKDYVIAINGDNEATFKQLVKDGPDLYLKPRNKSYPTKPLGSSRIIGVVVGLQMMAKPGDETWPI